MRRLALVLVLAVAACSSGEGSGTTTTGSTVAPVAGTPLRVDDVAAAVAAVEEARGGTQQYTEINAIPDGVNVFVALGGGQELDYFYADGGLQEPGAPTASQATPFTLDGVDLGAPSRLVEQVQQQFPGARVQQVALVHLPELGLVWGVRSRSVRGGDLNSFFSPDGTRLLSVVPT